MSQNEMPQTPVLELLPAVDVAGGQAVRLVQGAAGSETSYGDPLEAALAFQEQGAEWIHLVDLDAAFGRGSNRELLAELVGRMDVAVELSGGIRDDESLAAALATGVLGALIATPALRTRGVYLILLTTGVTFCVQVLLENFDYIGGVGGLGGMSGATVWHVYGAVVIVGVLLWWLSRSHLQRMLDAVREDEQVAAALGINTVYLKVVCFALGAALAALAGGLYSHYMSFIRPENFGVLVSVYVVLYVVFGGVNNLWGALLGAVVLTLLPELIRGLASWRPLVFGLLIVILLLVRPEGLLPWRSATLKSRLNDD